MVVPEGERSTGREAFIQVASRRRLLGARDVVEHAVQERELELLLRRERRHALEAEPWVHATRALQKRLGDVDAGHASGREAVAEQGGRLAVAAAEVQDRAWPKADGVEAPLQPLDPPAREEGPVLTGGGKPSRQVLVVARRVPVESAPVAHGEER